MEKELELEFDADLFRRIILALALAFFCMSLHSTAMPWKGYLPIWGSFFCGLVFGFSVTANPWFLPRMGLAISVACMTLNWLYAYGHEGGRIALGVSSGGLTAIFAGVCAFTFVPIRPRSKGVAASLNVPTVGNSVH